ncbi:hypothetical protein [Shewanella acanthi]|uniref:hypothetical protein n=1 Tax=Shewanella acanthi TaxID=2864212 RepID=UPI001C6563F8|nr:hypothetical protein [Shewanella acanthi]QYJ80529.1 hypothetical protein K0H61_03795 [Shewanella acanthi]
MILPTAEVVAGKMPVPLWFKFIAILSLLWNIAGGMAFIMQITMTPEAMAQLGPNQIKLYETAPGWLDILFGVAVLSGVIGCLLLVFKQSHSYKLFVLSFLAALLQMSYVFGIQHAAQLLGVQALVMPSIVLLWGAFLIWLSRFGMAKG